MNEYQCSNINEYNCDKLYYIEYKHFLDTFIQPERSKRENTEK
jgi:hypothetical protein